MPSIVITATVYTVHLTLPQPTAWLVFDDCFLYMLLWVELYLLSYSQCELLVHLQCLTSWW